MIRWSSTHTLVAGLALIAVTNAVALVGAGYNRAGDPESRLTLTQRELLAPYSWGFRNENSGLTLRLQWRVLGAEEDGNYSYAYRGGAPGWFDKTKLAELGFDVSRPADAPAGRRYYGRLLAQEVLLVLELDGPAYQAALDRARKWKDKEEALKAANPGSQEFERRARLAREALEQEERRNSRLFVIDAGLEVGPLRARYPDRTRYAILRGRVRPWLSGSDGKSRVAGYVEDLSNDDIVVPLNQRRVLGPLEDSAMHLRDKARYEITVVFGRRLEPWIESAAAR